MLSVPADFKKLLKTPRQGRGLDCERSPTDENEPLIPPFQAFILCTLFKRPMAALVAWKMDTPQVKTTGEKFSVHLLSH